MTKLHFEIEYDGKSALTPDDVRGLVERHLRTQVLGSSVSVKLPDYSDQKFTEAVRLPLSLEKKGRDFVSILLLMRNLGCLRNDSEVAAFDAWEQTE